MPQLSTVNSVSKDPENKNLFLKICAILWQICVKLFCAVLWLQVQYIIRFGLQVLSPKLISKPTFKFVAFK